MDHLIIIRSVFPNQARSLPYLTLIKAQAQHACRRPSSQLSKIHECREILEAPDDCYFRLKEFWEVDAEALTSREPESRMQEHAKSPPRPESTEGYYLPSCSSAQKSR
jgi:hypothetical protein